MWVFLSDSMLSIVSGPRSSNKLVVRARLPGDIERIFPGVAVVEGGGTDYRFRATVDREVAARKISALISGIDYPNFKGSVADDKRHDIYMKVWSVMKRAQDEVAGLFGRKVRS